MFKKLFAFALAASLLVLAGCHSENRDLTGFSGNSGDTSDTAPIASGEKLSFTTTDINGKTVSLEDFSGAEVIMFNMWEPWCGPCREELPDLQKLYAKYGAEGLMIVGVYSDTDGLKETVQSNGIQYPMIKSCAAFNRFNTGYVPTTVFTDGEGNVLSDEAYIGSKSYEEWESVILSYLHQ